MNSRDQIFNRLKAGLSDIKPIERTADVESVAQAIDGNEFMKQIALVNAEVLVAEGSHWSKLMPDIIERHQIKTLMASEKRLPGLFEQQEPLNCSVLDLFQQQMSDTKEHLFDNVDASITTVSGAICETGSLILIPDQHEPRTASLVPPVHIALVFESQLVATFADFVPTQDKDNMPTNIILISGPSKTADIQQTVAYGAHGPKHLVVIYCKNHAGDGIN